MRMYRGVLEDWARSLRVSTDADAVAELRKLSARLGRDRDTVYRIAAKIPTTLPQIQTAVYLRRVAEGIGRVKGDIELVTRAFETHERGSR